jgi:nucleotide-binding universal stress UspA family protein
MYKCILHATDLQENHFALCEKAKQFADYHHAKLYLIHIIEIPQTLLLAQNLGFTELVAPAKEDAQTVLKTVGEALKVPVSHQHVEVGMVKYHILEYADTLKCDLIILGRHSPQGFSHLLGSTTYHVMQDANCDVLTLK